MAAAGAVCVSLAGGAGTAYADPVAPPPFQGSTALTVTGDVQRTVVMSMDELAAMPANTEAVTFETAHGVESHGYTGPQLEAILNAAQPNGGGPEKHTMLTAAVVATGADGYSVVLSWGELSPSLAARPPLVAWSEDGRRLDRARLVVPDDIGGARYVRDLETIRVVQLAGG
jgi:DMSO/TMAO reductase YedYZ molybdopterin-dependent catalytic subunit